MRPPFGCQKGCAKQTLQAFRIAVPLTVLGTMSGRGVPGTPSCRSCAGSGGGPQGRAANAWTPTRCWGTGWGAGDSGYKTVAATKGCGWGVSDSCCWGGWGTVHSVPYSPVGGQEVEGFVGFHVGGDAIPWGVPQRPRRPTSIAGIIRKWDLQVECGAAMICRGPPETGFANPVDTGILP